MGPHHGCCNCYCENYWLKLNKILCVCLGIFLVSACVGLVVGVGLRMLDQGRDNMAGQDQTRMLENNKESTNLKFSLNKTSEDGSRVGRFKSITNGIFAVYNDAGDILYTMESEKKVDSGYVLFAEVENHLTVENVAIDIKLIEAPRSVLDAPVVVPHVDQ